MNNWYFDARPSQARNEFGIFQRTLACKSSIDTGHSETMFNYFVVRQRARRPEQAFLHSVLCQFLYSVGLLWKSGGSEWHGVYWCLWHEVKTLCCARRRSQHYFCSVSLKKNSIVHRCESQAGHNSQDVISSHNMYYMAPKMWWVVEVVGAFARKW